MPSEGPAFVPAFDNRGGRYETRSPAAPSAKRSGQPTVAHEDPSPARTRRPAPVRRTRRSSGREAGELDVGEGDVQTVAASAPVAEVGVTQCTGEDHQLLLARADVPDGEQLTGRLSRQGLGGPPHPRIVRGPPPEPRTRSALGCGGRSLPLRPGHAGGPAPGAAIASGPPPRSSRPPPGRAEVGTIEASSSPSAVRCAAKHPATRPRSCRTLVSREQKPRASLGARENGPSAQRALQPLRNLSHIHLPERPADGAAPCGPWRQIFVARRRAAAPAQPANAGRTPLPATAARTEGSRCSARGRARRALQPARQAGRFAAVRGGGPDEAAP
ncbi:hypothetical protein Save01_06526 [Streptomyces avermitilis]